MDGKFLGKIEKAEFGIISGSTLGLILDFSFNNNVKVSSGLAYTWVVTNRNFDFKENVLGVTERIHHILEDAKIRHVSQLVGKPIEIEIERNLFKDFRILTEVL